MLTKTRGTGFLKYWTVSNIPLFLIATPMLLTLIWSSLQPFLSSKEERRARKSSSKSKAKVTEPTNAHILRRLALPQLIVAILALTTFHVQIINRIASGYALWYIHLAYAVVNDQRSTSQRTSWTKVGICSMIVYAIVQAGLFSAFLPPA
jgi:GPI mannosyltransferase 2